MHLFSSHKVFSVSLTWLIQSELPWEFLSSKGNREWILA